MNKSAEKTTANNQAETEPIRKKPEYTGSRWAGLILLIITVLISLLFYLKGKKSLSVNFTGKIFGPSTYTFNN